MTSQVFKTLVAVVAIAATVNAQAQVTNPRIVAVTGKEANEKVAHPKATTMKLGGSKAAATPRSAPDAQPTMMHTTTAQPTTTQSRSARPATQTTSAPEVCRPFLEKEAQRFERLEDSCEAAQTQVVRQKVTAEAGAQLTETQHTSQKITATVTAASETRTQLGGEVVKLTDADKQVRDCLTRQAALQRRGAAQAEVETLRLECADDQATQTTVARQVEILRDQVAAKLEEVTQIALEFDQQTVIDLQKEAQEVQTQIETLVQTGDEETIQVLKPIYQNQVTQITKVTGAVQAKIQAEIAQTQATENVTSTITSTSTNVDRLEQTVTVLAGVSTPSVVEQLVEQATTITGQVSQGATDITTTFETSTTAEVTVATAEVAVVEARVTAAHTRLTEATSALQGLGDDASEDLRDRVQQIVQDARSELESLTELQTTVKANLDRVKTVTTNAESTVTTFESQVTTGATTIVNATAQVNATIVQIHNLTTQGKVTEQDQHQIEELQGQLEDLINTIQDSVGGIQSGVVHVEDTVQGVELAVSQTVSAEFEAEVSVESNTVARVEREARRAQDEQEKHTREVRVSEITTQVTSEFTANEDSIKEEAANLSEEDLVETLVNFRKNATVAQALIEHLDEVIVDIEKRITETDAKVTQEHTVTVEVQGEIRKTQTQVTTVQNQVGDTQFQCAHARAALQAQVDQCDAHAENCTGEAKQCQKADFVSPGMPIIRTMGKQQGEVAKAASA